MRIFGLIGYPLEHSFSGKYFSEKFSREKITDAEYKLYELKNLSGFDPLLQDQKELAGLNVTIPHKMSIIPYLDSMDPLAKSIGAVNCIAIKRTAFGYSTKGFNTDAEGFRKSLMPLLEPWHERALILGTGGSSRAVGHVLKEIGVPFVSVSRNPEGSGQLGYDDIDEGLLKHHKIIVNTTPVGMYPNVNELPRLPYEHLTREHLLYDLVYNPLETKFLQAGRMAGARTRNGLEMLRLQADEAWRVWNGGF